MTKAGPDKAKTIVANGKSDVVTTVSTRPREVGGPKGPEPTRYGDWETNGRCSDF